LSSACDKAARLRRDAERSQPCAEPLARLLRPPSVREVIERHALGSIYTPPAAISAALKGTATMREARVVEIISMVVSCCLDVLMVSIGGRLRLRRLAEHLTDLVI
jgi:hypothetical protein